MAKRKSLEERFWEKVDKALGQGPNGDCWMWIGANRWRYGTFKFCGRTRNAHVVSWILAHGTEPKDFVLHRCDVSCCVNPSHLFEGSQKDNMHDMQSKGRKVVLRGCNSPPHLHPEKMSRGESNGLSKLTDKKVRAIRELYAYGDIRPSWLARQYRVAPGTIYAVIERKTWKHVA